MEVGVMWSGELGKAIKGGGNEVIEVIVMEGVEVRVKCKTGVGGGEEVSVAVGVESAVTVTEGEAVGITCEAVEGGK